MDLKAESSGVGCFDWNDEWIIPYLEAGRDCRFHILPVLTSIRCKSLGMSTLKYTVQSGELIMYLGME